ncbi:hypothetical protein [Pseudoxanthomonas sp. Root630]|uniref:hypothetical protein n=1 Tax=Pseudoxanthomonas sp. Root630 TaxID=1736574 RepID=UPI000B28093F|nr:hypothetical protein [Pseudoxanthomonas sp. Root630]
MRATVRGLVWVSALLPVGHAGAAHPIEPVAPLPLDAKVDGKGYPELTAAWWQWAEALDGLPYRDRDGRACGVAQEGPVWFLAGTTGRFNARRECTVPLGKHLLLPVINMIHYTPGDALRGDRVPSCRQLQARAAVNNNQLSSAVVLLDGVPVKDVSRYRVRSSGCFPLFPDQPPRPGHLAQVAASDGYWLLFPPLSPGRHTVSVGANYDAEGSGYGRMVQSFEYVLWVGGDGVAAR